MPSSRILFDGGSCVAPELILAARALAAGLRSGGRDAWVVEGLLPLDSAEDLRISLGGDGAPVPSGWKMEIDGGNLLLSRDGVRQASIPMVVSCARSRSRMPRVLVAGGGSDRGARMTLKTIEELFRRRSPARMICWGAPSDELLRARAFEEIHLDLTPDELERLLGSGAAVLDPADEPEDSSVLGIIARASGLPVVTRAGDTSARPAEWSADAFADAIETAISAGTSGPRSAVDAAALVAEALER